MLAAELALAGIDVAIVERRPNQDVAGARAGGLHARTIEVLDQRGVAERFLAAGTIMQVAGFAMIPLDIGDFPTRHPYGLALPQAQIERLLADWVRELGVPTYRERDVTGFVQDETGVTVTLSDGAVLGAQYLVGCDGGRSFVRKHAGIAFPGWDASTTYLIAECSLTEEPPYGVRHGERGVQGVAKLEGERRARVVFSEPEVRSGETPTFDELRAALVSMYGRDFGVHDVTWISRFGDAARQAADYRSGRVLLAGDAAHVHAPNGGQGLNIGVQDAVNLGWKLARVIHEASPVSLLDTYQAERHPVAARVLSLTLAQTALGRGDERTAALRALTADLLKLDEPRRRFGGMMSGLDVRYDLGPGHPLLGRRMPDLDLVTADGPRRVYELLRRARSVLLELDDRARLDERAWTGHVTRTRARYEGAWSLPVVGDVPAPSAVLVRPDGYVGWVGEGDDTGLHEALGRWCGATASLRTT